jgi:hypothetical protein
MEDNKVLNDAINSPKPLPNFSRKRDGFNRSDIVDAVLRTFHMIGGVQAMAIWANGNKTEFYKLYGKLLPSTNLTIGDNAKVTIFHAIPPTALDQHQPTPLLTIDSETGEVVGELARLDLSSE